MKLLLRISLFLFLSLWSVWAFSDHKIIVYGTEVCPRTKEVRHTLLKNHIPYVFKNVNNEANNEELGSKLDKNGIGTDNIDLPVVDIDGKILVKATSAQVLALNGKPEVKAEDDIFGNAAPVGGPSHPLKLVPPESTDSSPRSALKTFPELSLKQIVARLDGQKVILVEVYDSSGCALCDQMDRGVFAYSIKHPEIEIYRLNRNTTPEIQNSFFDVKAHVPTLLLFANANAISKVTFRNFGDFDDNMIIKVIEKGQTQLTAALKGRHRTTKSGDESTVAQNSSPADEMPVAKGAPPPVAAPPATKVPPATVPKVAQAPSSGVTLDKSQAYLEIYSSINCFYCGVLEKALQRTTGLTFFPIDVDRITYNVPIVITNWDKMTNQQEKRAIFSRGLPEIHLVLGSKVVDSQNGVYMDLSPTQGLEQYKRSFRPVLRDYLSHHEIKSQP